MIAAFFLAVGIVGVFVSIFGFALAGQGALGFAAAGCAAVVALFSGSYFVKGLAQERAQASGLRRSPSFVALGVALILLGATAAWFIVAEAQEQLSESGPGQIERLDSAMADVLTRKVDNERRLAEYRTRTRKSTDPTPELRGQVFEMNLVHNIETDEGRLADLRGQREAIENAPTRLKIDYAAAALFLVGCVAVVAVGIVRPVKPPIAPASASPTE